MWFLFLSLTLLVTAHQAAATTTFIRSRGGDVYAFKPGNYVTLENLGRGVRSHNSQGLRGRVAKGKGIRAASAYEAPSVLDDQDSFEFWHKTVSQGLGFFSSPNEILQNDNLEYDAIIIPSGGLEEDGSPKPFVKERIDAVVPLRNKTRYWISSGAFSPRAKVKMTAGGALITEGRADAEYLVSKYGIPPNVVILEESAKDSIGNAYYSRLICEVLFLKRVLVVTNRFHMPRIRLVFDWVFEIFPRYDVMVDYLEAPDAGIAQDVLAEREKKEVESVKLLWNQTIPSIPTMEDLGKFLFFNHRAYAMDTNVGDYNIQANSTLLKESY